MQVKSLWSVGIIVFFAFALIGCGGASEPPPNTITEAGSTTVLPLAEELAEAYMAKHPDIKVTTQGGGSSTGIKAVAQGTVDIGAASRELKSNEQTLGLIDHVLARDGIVMIVHPSNPINDITKRQTIEIYAGNIKNWSEVGGSDGEIHVVCREEGSGTRDAFESLVMGSKGPLITKEAILQPSNGAVRTTVAGDPGAIGFVSIGYIDSSVKALTMDGFECTVESIQKRFYPLVRSLMFLTKGQPKGLVKDFIDFSLGPEGQGIVTKDYVPVR
jgi:phosphate transport system substrate-binding protein